MVVLFVGGVLAGAVIAALRAFPQWFLERKPRPTKRLTFTTWKHYRKGASLEEAGLLGPVCVVVGGWQIVAP